MSFVLGGNTDKQMLLRNSFACHVCIVAVLLDCESWSYSNIAQCDSSRD